MVSLFYYYENYLNIGCTYSEVGEDEIIEIQGAEAVQLNPTDAEIVELDSDDDDEGINKIIFSLQFNLLISLPRFQFP